MRISAKGALAAASKAKKLPGFGKAWNVNDKGIVFYPIYKDPDTGELELLVGSVWGYKVNDMNALGLKASFIPTNAEINENGEPDVPDVAFQFSKLASAFITGEKEKREQEINSKPWPTAAAQRSALGQLDHDYDTKNNMKARRPVISRLSLYISTEVLYVPMKDNKPMWDDAKLYSQTLSNERILKLYTIMNDKQYAVGPDDKYLEVMYNFTAADGEKSTAGRAQPIGQTPEYRLRVQFAEDAAKLDRLLAQLPDTSEIIENHNYSYRRIPESTLRSAFSSYSIMNSDNLNYLKEDGIDQVARAAKLIEELSLKPSINSPELLNRINEELAKEPADAPIMPTAAVEDGSKATAPTMDQLMNNPSRADAGDQEDLNDVSLD